MRRTIRLPWPPSVNDYYIRTRHGQVRLGPAGRDYRDQACRLVARMPPAEGRLRVTIECHPPNHRRRDLDNILKSLLDALQHAGVYADDGQIDDLRVLRGPVGAEYAPGMPGLVVVSVWPISTHATEATPQQIRDLIRDLLSRSKGLTIKHLDDVALQRLGVRDRFRTLDVVWRMIDDEVIDFTVRRDLCRGPKWGKQ